MSWKYKNLSFFFYFRHKKKFETKSLYEDIQVNELDVSNYQEIDVKADQIKRSTVQRVESPQH